MGDAVMMDTDILLWADQSHGLGLFLFLLSMVLMFVTIPLAIIDIRAERRLKRIKRLEEHLETEAELEKLRAVPIRVVVSEPYLREPKE